MTTVPEGLGPEQPDSDALLRRVVDVIGNAKSMPLSSSVMISRDEVLELLEEAINRLPEQLRQARWLLKEREEYLERARREADEIVAAARVQAEGMVQRTEVVREAQRVARVTVEQAEAHGRQLRNQAEDYVDAKLASFEATLERTLGVVQKGRRRLQAFAPEVPVEVLPSEPGLFDQDLM